MLKLKKGSFLLVVCLHTLSSWAEYCNCNLQVHLPSISLPLLMAPPITLISFNTFFGLWGRLCRSWLMHEASFCQLYFDLILLALQMHIRILSLLIVGSIVLCAYFCCSFIKYCSRFAGQGEEESGSANCLQRWSQRTWVDRCGASQNQEAHCKPGEC